MRLLGVLSKVYTLDDLINYARGLADEYYGLICIEAGKEGVSRAKKRLETALNFIADFSFDGDRAAVESILSADRAVQAQAG